MIFEITQKIAELFEELFNLPDSSREILYWLDNKLKNSELGQKGIQELNYVVESCNILGVNNLKINVNEHSYRHLLLSY